MALFQTYALYGMVQLFPFRYPQRDTTGGTTLINDRHATDKMAYYDYFAGDEPTGFFHSYLRQRKTQFNNATTLAAFWSEWTTCLNNMKNNNIDGEKWRTPRRIARLKNSRHLDRMFFPHNTDQDYILYVDSLISPTLAQIVNPDSLAVEACAKYVLSCDTIYRNRYDIPSGGLNDTLLVHQLEQEFNHLCIYGLVNPDTLGQPTDSLFYRRANRNKLGAYILGAKVINAISVKLHSYKANVNTAFETNYPEGAVDGYFGNDTTWIDSVLAKTSDINIVFFVTRPGDRPNYLTAINNAQNKIGGSRRIGIRYSWAATNNSAEYSQSSQVQLLSDLDVYVGNKKFLSVYSGQALDGKWTTLLKDANQHWKALASRLARCWLVFIDQFEEVGLDTRLWNSSGASITQDPNNGYIRIGKSSYIRNDSLYSKLASVVCKLDKDSESTGTSQNEHHFLIEKNDGSQNKIDMFTRKDTLYCQTLLGGTTYGVKLNLTVGQGMNEWKIIWNSNTVYFYLNGSLKHSESLYDRGAQGRFETAVRAKYLAGDDNNVQEMKVDSVLALYQTQCPPTIHIVSTSVSNSPATAYLTYYVSEDARVWVYIERWDWGSATRQGISLVTQDDSLGAGEGQQNVSHVFDGSELSSLYRWMVKAENIYGEQIDSAFSTGFYFNTTNNTMLSSASSDMAQNISLPRKFSLAQNQPNPFNPSTTISYEIPAGFTQGVNLKVFNLRGQIVITLVKEDKRQPGRYSVFWDGKDEFGRQLPSGVYLYRLESGNYVSTRKMVLLK